MTSLTGEFSGKMSASMLDFSRPKTFRDCWWLGLERKKPWGRFLYDVCIGAPIKQKETPANGRRREQICRYIIADFI